jgi:hypothetical protein
MKTKILDVALGGVVGVMVVGMVGGAIVGIGLSIYRDGYRDCEQDSDGKVRERSVEIGRIEGRTEGYTQCQADAKALELQCTNLCYVNYRGSQRLGSALDKRWAHVHHVWKGVCHCDDGQTFKLKKGRWR